MPQATDELRRQWTDDAAALHQLGDNFTNDNGWLRPKLGYTPSALDYLAIDYLFQEWDYCYTPEPA